MATNTVYDYFPMLPYTECRKAMVPPISVAVTVQANWSCGLIAQHVALQPAMSNMNDCSEGDSDETVITFLGNPL